MVALTAVMMVAEIAGGMLYGSIALVADGWHMGTHVAALAIAGPRLSVRAAAYARCALLARHRQVGELAAFASAIVLGMIALGIAYKSALRFLHPVVIYFREAVPIAVLGLCVNLASAWLLRETHDHVHGPSRGHQDHDGHGPPRPRPRSWRRPPAHRQDLNYRAAYVHVLADALTSVLAIAGLSAAWAFGWTFMDPLVGLVGTIVILSWSVSLIRAAGGVLLDTVPDPALAQHIRERIETGGDRLADLHLWRLGPGHAAMIASIVSDSPLPPAVYKQRLEGLTGLSHVTIEVNQCALVAE